LTNFLNQNLANLAGMSEKNTYLTHKNISLQGGADQYEDEQKQQEDRNEKMNELNLRSKRLLKRNQKKESHDDNNLIKSNFMPSL
jgi:hypothetical protein